MLIFISLELEFLDEIVDISCLFRNSLIAHWLSEFFLEDIVVLMGEVHIDANIYIFFKVDDTDNFYLC